MLFSVDQMKLSSLLLSTMKFITCFLTGEQKSSQGEQIVSKRSQIGNPFCPLPFKIIIKKKQQSPPL